ncbi:hypothetical protein DIPPA_19890 [Diplonema papillatum]|nr:hypothetical protein DIPPA_19890 [Diplonema papillatum]|eukprot:gene17262-26508_t
MVNPAVILASPVDSAEKFEAIKAEFAAVGEANIGPKHMAGVKVASFHGVAQGEATLVKLKQKFPDVSFEFDGEAHAMATAAPAGAVGPC